MRRRNILTVRVGLKWPGMGASIYPVCSRWLTYRYYKSRDNAGQGPNYKPFTECSVQYSYHITSNRFKKRNKENELFSLVGNSGGWYDRSEQSTLKYVTEITHQSKLYIVLRASKKASRNRGSL
jgi:hypothetical protein